MSTIQLIQSLFSIFVFFGLFSNQAVTAEELTILEKNDNQTAPRFIEFSPVVIDPFLLTASSCQSTVSDTAHYRFELPITSELLADLQATLTAGNIPVIAFKTEAAVATEGSVQVDIAGLIGLQIFTPEGKGYDVYREDVVFDPTGCVMCDLIIFELTSEMVNDVMPGDNLVITARAQGTADLVGCDSDDQAFISWEIKDIWGAYGGPVLLLDGNPDWPIVTG